MERPMRKRGRSCERAGGGGAGGCRGETDTYRDSMRISS